MNRPKVIHFPGTAAEEVNAADEHEMTHEQPVDDLVPHEGPEKRVGLPDRRAPDSPMRGGLTGRRRGRPRLGKAVARDLSRDEEILKIAVEVVWRRGFAGTKLSDIAEAAGIVKGSLYHYFDSKEEIYARLVNNVRSLFEGEADQLATGTAIERLDHFIRSRVAVILRHPLEIALLNRDLVRMKGAIGDWAREGPKKNFAVIRKIILQGQKEGVFRAADPDLVSSMILGVLAHVPNWYHREHPAQPDELLREVLEYALGGIVTSIDLIPKRS